MIPPLAEHHRVIALDQLGFGASEKPQIDYSIQTYVDFLGEFLRTLEVKDFTLIGESLGGRISALYTIEALGPENTGKYALAKPGRLVLQDAAGMVPLKAAVGAIPVTGTLSDARSIWPRCCRFLIDSFRRCRRRKPTEESENTNVRNRNDAQKTAGPESSLDTLHCSLDWDILGCGISPEC